MGKLMYSDSAELITLAEIKMLPKPVSIGPHHHPYPFFDYITDVKDAMELEGMVIMNEEYVLQHEGQQLAHGGCSAMCVACAPGVAAR